jgi:pimeloyl-ACP methyl ester carboxylesterase
MDVRWHEGERDGVRLACADYGGNGPPALLLHGLAGHAREWDATAAWLSQRCRVLAPDARGHGRSERRPDDVSADAFARDAAWWLERLARGPATVVGQSLGGITAMLVAAARPELARSLVVAEATPEAEPRAVDAVARWLASWPTPFASDGDALAFFGGETLRARAWSAGLERRAGGLWPAFDADVLVAALTASQEHDHWDAWTQGACPALVVRATAGAPCDEVRRMLSTRPRARLAEIADAGHDVHLDQPERWRSVVLEFICALDESDSGARANSL